MKHLLTILLLSNIACTLTPDGPSDPSKFKLLESMDVLPSGLTKYEDDDVVCYIYRGYSKGGLSCHPKVSGD